MRLFGSIESRHGLAEPRAQEPGQDRRLNAPEAFLAFILPPYGVILAVWRFGRGDIGPGFADLLLAGMGATAITGLVQTLLA